MNKTALQQLIDKWKSEIGSYIPNAHIYKAFIEDAESFLEIEKQQIIDAHDKGVYDCLSGKQYYNDNFKSSVASNQRT